MIDQAPTAAQADAAHALHELVKVTVGEIEGRFVALGQMLLAMQADEQYRALGYPSFEAWLADPDINLPRRQAFKCMRVARAFLPPPGAADFTPEAAYTALDAKALGIEKAALVAPFVSPDDPERSREWIDKARQLAVNDLRREIADDARGGPLAGEAAYWEELAYALAAVARRLPEAADPLAVLDNIVSRCMAARARHEGMQAAQQRREDGA